MQRTSTSAPKDEPREESPRLTREEEADTAAELGLLLPAALRPRGRRGALPAGRGRPDAARGGNPRLRDGAGGRVRALRRDTAPRPARSDPPPGRRQRAGVPRHLRLA